MLILLSAMAALIAEEPKPTPIGNPAEWVKSDDYPEEALVAGHEGAVGFTLKIDERGRAAGCTVTETSKSTGLDAATCSIMRERARFTPARAEGSPVASTFRLRIVWKLPEMDIAEFPAGRSEIMLQLTPEGGVESCSLDTFGRASVEESMGVCEMFRSSFSGDRLQLLAKQFKAVRFGTAVSIGDRDFSIDSGDWGTKISRVAAETHLNKSGAPLRCFIIESFGDEIVDPCGAFSGKQEANLPSDQTLAHRVILENAVYGLPR